MQPSDLADICRIAELCHPDFPEERDVLAEKQTVSPDTCFVWETEGRVGGYLLAHPFRLGEVPALDSMLGVLPDNSDTLYLHDIAIAPDARSGGAGGKAVALILQCALKMGLSTLSLVAVNGSPPFWEKHGFKPWQVDAKLKQKLLTYSEDACYMTRSVD